MDSNTKLPVITYPEGFDDRWEYEMTPKGYLCNVEVGLGDGRRFLLNFFDPVRLAQDLEGEAETGRPYFAEQGLIVLTEVTTRTITESIHSLWREGFFEMLKPLECREKMMVANLEMADSPTSS
jgi:hypothetical protein